MRGYKVKLSESIRYFHRMYDTLERALLRAIKDNDYASQDGIRRKLGHIENAIHAMEREKYESEGQ